MSNWREEVQIYGKFYLARKITHPKLGDGIEIDLTGMSDPCIEDSEGNCKLSDGVINFEFLSYLSQMFGTINIDVDRIQEEGGCPTCAFGDRKGFEIQIYTITKNNPFDN